MRQRVAVLGAEGTGAALATGRHPRLLPAAGLGTTQLVLLAITMLVGVTTLLPGRATVQGVGIHLVLFLAFLGLPLNP